MSTTVQLDGYVLDTLMGNLVGHDRRPAAFLVYLHLWGASAGSRLHRVAASLQSIADNTGLSKSTAQAAVIHLRSRRLLSTERSSPTAVPVHTVLRPWRRR